MRSTSISAVSMGRASSRSGSLMRVTSWRHTDRLGRTGFDARRAFRIGSLMRSLADSGQLPLGEVDVDVEALDPDLLAKLDGARSSLLEDRDRLLHLSLPCFPVFGTRHGAPPVA